MPSPNEVHGGQTASGLKLRFCERIKYITTVRTRLMPCVCTNNSTVPSKIQWTPTLIAFNHITYKVNRQKGLLL